MKKKLFAFLAALAILLSMTIPAFATESRFSRYGEAGDSENLQTVAKLTQAIYDTYSVDAFYLYNDELSGEGSAKNYATETAPQISSEANGICYASTADYTYLYCWGSCEGLFTDEERDDLYSTCNTQESSAGVDMAAISFLSTVYNKLSTQAGADPVIATGDTDTTEAADTTGEDVLDASQLSDAPAGTLGAVGPNNTIMLAPDYPYTRVFDLGDDLTDEQEQALEAKLVEISDRQKCSVVALTVSSLDGKSSMAYADDFFDYNMLGYGATSYTDGDGCILLICPETRDYWISTKGYGIYALTDAGIEYIGDRIIPSMKAGDWNGAFEIFGSTVDEFITQAKTDKPYDKGSLPKPKKTFKEIAKGLIISLIVGLIVAFIIMKSVKSSYEKAVHQKSNASDYLVNGSLQMTGAYENFLYSNVTQTRIERESSSGGGSSTHSSSSGSSHGGGGGKF